MEEIDKKELQGLLVRGYSYFPAACYLLLKIKSARAAKDWLSTGFHQFTAGSDRRPETALNIAFTWQGLRALGLSEDSLATFPFEFQDGMATPHKQFLFGDYGSSDPARWTWGGKNNEPIDVLLLLYAPDNSKLDKQYITIRSQWTDDPFEEIKRLDTKEITARKEHFGFHDGISQPAIIGLGRDNEPAENKIAPGEFILGYKNEYGQLTAAPTVLATTDRTGLLPPAIENLLPLSRDGGTQKDLGQNGSFLVFRQLEQDVRKFWDFMEAAAGNPARPGDSANPNDSGAPARPADPTDMIRLASKIVGRWPSGTALELSPEKDKPDLDDKNRFNYIPADKDGLICPFGAHVRRTNPRDSINRGDSTSIEVSKKHRLLRRGRSYGTPLAASMKPEDILRGRDDGSARGLHFICLNADLGRQFEFIQNFWINNPKFDGLYDEKDPLTGNYHDPQAQKSTGTFGIPRERLRERFTDLPEFVTVKGGAYFFLPGIRALQYLSSL
jgi:Dyp-type peroxidase family